MARRDLLQWQPVVPGGYKRAPRERRMVLFGVYRGVVLDNSDPQVSGRVKVNVEGRQAWALVTVTSPKLQVGAMVIVAFERGDPDMPVVA